MKDKAEKGAYRDPAAVFADFDRVFANSRRYNPPGSDVYYMATVLQVGRRPRGGVVVVRAQALQPAPRRKAKHTANCMDCCAAFLHPRWVQPSNWPTCRRRCWSSGAKWLSQSCRSVPSRAQQRRRAWWRARRPLCVQRTSARCRTRRASGWRRAGCQRGSLSASQPCSPLPPTSPQAQHHPT